MAQDITQLLLLVKFRLLVKAHSPADPGGWAFLFAMEIMSHLISRNAYYVNKGGVNLMPTEDRNHDCEVERLEAELREIERIVLEILHIVRKIERELGEDCTE